MIKIAPSLLSSDFANLSLDVRQMDELGADYLHIDVMDGHFVPNITIGPLVVKAIRPYSKLPFDVHLMIEQPERYVEDFVQAGANLVTVHVEASPHLQRTLGMIRSLGARASVALNPHTPISMIEHVLDQLDMILIMTVNPGFGGQSFIHSMVQKIADTRNMLAARGFGEIDIEVDGGINRETAEQVRKAGATVLVAGNAIFTADDRKEEISLLRGN
ncbi:MAG: ribulose-phosphate 3-epimerase [Bacilli bacterium]|nr:ribulose-phosphate 3-epimerase [Bacilli bacterium]